MTSSFSRRRLRSAALAAGLAGASLCLADIATAAPLATDLGALPASQMLHATVWLARKDEAGFQRALKAIYDPASPSFHHWMTPAQYSAYMPDQDSISAVRDSLAKSGLTIVRIAADGRSIDVSGNAALVQRAFAAPIHTFQSAGKTFVATTAKPALAGDAGALVGAITGLGTARTRSFALRQTDLSTGHPVAMAVNPTAITGGADGSPINPYLTDSCFHGTTVQGFVAAEGEIVLSGRKDVNGYFAAGKGYGVCGYDSTQLRAHYGLTGPISRGLDGKGQTIAIVVAYGSPFILSDINSYSALMGLPQLGASNFKLIAPLGDPLAYDSDWSAETTIDVTMAHGMAPGAKIVLLVAPTNGTADLINTFAYIVEHNLADVVSMSFGEPELGADGSDAVAWGLVTAEASAYGIGVNVSSGDYGDNGVGTPVGASSTPSDSAYVTSVGGTSLSLPTAEGTRDIGWGWQSTFPNTNRLVKTKLQVGAGEAIGAGGGESVYFGKPTWQSALPGQGRQQPDISATADPLTGVDLVLTVNDFNELIQVVTVAGGTSVASPLFAGISALANQRAGQRIGQIAPLLPLLQGAPIKDIVPLTSQDPVMTATKNGKPLNTPDVTPDALALLPEGTTGIEQIFVVRPIFSETIFTFGLDTSLTTAVGWDNVTGYGEPNGNAFLVALAKASKGGQQ